jgi:hypothetical protein
VVAAAFQPPLLSEAYQLPLPEPEERFGLVEAEQVRTPVAEHRPEVRHDGGVDPVRAREAPLQTGAVLVFTPSRDLRLKSADERSQDAVGDGGVERWRGMASDCGGLRLAVPSRRVCRPGGSELTLPG